MSDSEEHLVNRDPDGKSHSPYYADPVDYTIETMQNQIDTLTANLALKEKEYEDLTVYLQSVEARYEEVVLKLQQEEKKSQSQAVEAVKLRKNLADERENIRQIRAETEGDFE
jgi:uncharacterized protein (DUF342 family)